MCLMQILEDGGPPRAPPASKEVVEKLPVIVFSEEMLKTLGAEVECCICKENLVIGDKMQELPCKHTFHPPCLKPWLVFIKKTHPCSLFKRCVLYKLTGKEEQLLIKLFCVGRTSITLVLYAAMSYQQMIRSTRTGKRGRKRLRRRGKAQRMLSVVVNICTFRRIVTLHLRSYISLVGPSFTCILLLFFFNMYLSHSYSTSFLIMNTEILIFEISNCSYFQACFCLHQ